MFFLRFLFLISFMLAAPAHAILKIDINRGHVEPMNIALPFATEGDGAQQQIINLVEEDLESTGLFRSSNRAAFLQAIANSSTVPDFPAWQKINATALVTSDVSQANGMLKSSFRLWDVFSSRQLTGHAFSTTTANWRRSAHMMADKIYHRLTGESGYFDSRIVYVSESGDPRKRIKRLAIMDYDGANHRYLTSGKNIVITPRFSPTSQKVIYMSYRSEKPAVFLLDVDTGKQQQLGLFEGISFAPRFSPNGRSVIMSVTKNGNSDIVTFDLHSGARQKLTHDRAIDTSPSYSPKGDRIVFNSDRGGSQQLYIMGNDGSNVHRISFGKGNYGTPVWSPRGDYVAFTKMSRGKFYIGVMRPDGSGERLLTESYLDESPSWSPNGRVIIFARQTPGSSSAGRWNLHSIDLTGENERKIPTPLDGSDPAWSPLLTQ